MASVSPFLRMIIFNIVKICSKGQKVNGFQVRQNKSEETIKVLGFPSFLNIC